LPYILKSYDINIPFSALERFDSTAKKCKDEITLLGQNSSLTSH